MAKEIKTLQVGRFPLDVPQIDYGAFKALYKMHFGKSGKYYIGKCMSLTQAIPTLSNTIAAAVRTGSMSEDNWLYQAVTYIRKNRVMKGRLEVVMQGEVPSSALLIEEYKLLKKAEQDPDCLNQNTSVHIPKWVEVSEVAKFNKFLADEAKKSNKAGNTATNTRKKHKG